MNNPGIRHVAAKRRLRRIMANSPTAPVHKADGATWRKEYHNPVGDASRHNGLRGRQRARSGLVETGETEPMIVCYSTDPALL